jgi:hypothetical protein
LGKYKTEFGSRYIDRKNSALLSLRTWGRVAAEERRMGLFES